MRLTAKERDLGTAEHEVSARGDEPNSLARELASALAAIKREVAAILLVAVVGAPLVMVWLEGLREVAVLAGYGLGALIWVHARLRGLGMAARRARRAGGEGAAGGDGP